MTKERIRKITYEGLGDKPLDRIWVEQNKMKSLINLLFLKIEDLQEQVANNSCSCFVEKK
tara:strand:+ start:4732 stop:4911 length:180 start_codon:yes stop_codon:yes gene_type:complete